MKNYIEIISNPDEESYIVATPNSFGALLLFYLAFVKILFGLSY